MILNEIFFFFFLRRDVAFLLPQRFLEEVCGRPWVWRQVGRGLTRALCEPEGRRPLASGPFTLRPWAAPDRAQF